MIEFDAPGLQRLSTRESKQAPREVSATQRGVERLASEVPNLVVVVAATAEEVKIADDDGEEIVEVVRHAAREIANDLHLLSLLQLRASVSQLGRAFLDQRLDRRRATAFADEVEDQRRCQQQSGDKPAQRDL